jgi:hypothetical protein
MKKGIKQNKQRLGRCIRVFLLSFILFLSASIAKAQMVVYDPAQFGNMLQSIAHQAKQVITASKTLTETKNILLQAKAAKEEIENLHKLHREAQEALKIARGIVDLKWSDLDVLTGKALSVSVDPHIFMPDMEGTQGIIYTLKQAPSSGSAKELYSLLTGINSFKGADSFEAFEEQLNGALVNQFAYTEMADQKMLQTAMSYNVVAEEMISQANELIQAVKKDNRLTMNEAERISTLKGCQDVLLQSLQLKTRADEMIRSVIESGSASKSALKQSYKNALFRKALAQTPQSKYGQ